MTQENISNKMLTTALIVIIILAAIVVVYVNLYNNGEKTDDDNNNQIQLPSVNLSISYGSQQINYDFEDIQDMEYVTGTSRYIKASPYFKDGIVIINPPLNESANEYTGVKISTLVDKLDNLPESYNVTISALDYSTVLTNEEINGNISLFDENGILQDAESSVILAYKKDGEYLADDKGALMIAVVGDEVISLSNIWVSQVIDIEVTA